MHLNYMAWAIPMFLLFIGIEYWVARKKGWKYFTFSNSITNLNVGIAERLLDTFTVGLFYFVYEYLYRHFGIFSIRPGVLLWITLLICTDFTWLLWQHFHFLLEIAYAFRQAGGWKQNYKAAIEQRYLRLLYGAPRLTQVTWPRDEVKVRKTFTAV